MDDDLTHNPDLFDSRSWLVIGKYAPLAIELENYPKSRREEVGPGATIPTLVVIQEPRKGRTGKRQKIEVYSSLRSAMADRGRWVRTSIESEKTMPLGRARKARGAKVDQGRPGPG